MAGNNQSTGNRGCFFIPDCEPPRASALLGDRERMEIMSLAIVPYLKQEECVAARSKEGQFHSMSSLLF